MNNKHGQKTPTDLRLRFPLPTGTRLDHYVVEEVLGAGGFGITYLAEHAVLRKKYAIKEYFPQAFSYREGISVRPTESNGPTYQWGLERFTTEAQALARFKHPSIVDVASIFETNGTAYIVLAYENGRDMRAWLRDLGRPPTQDELDRLIEPLLSALDEIHQRNLMHRDIAPDNLLIRDDGTPVLIDFGSARESVRNKSSAMSAIVKHGYSPPEQYASRSDLQGAWTDIYALAATLYKAITGSTPPESTERMMHDVIPSVVQVAQDTYRRTFLEAIDWGLRLRPEERPQSVTAWRELLFRGTGRRFTPTSEALPPVQRPSSPPRRPVARRSGPSRPPASAQDAAAAVLAAKPSTPSRSAAPTSMRLTETGRPDLSLLDELEKRRDDENETATFDHASARKVYLAVIGFIGGAVGGGLCSVFLASIFAASCFADSCIMSYFLPCIIIGAIVGLAGGLYLARTMDDPDKPAGTVDPF
jgi:serine/threonine protein kinase